jgi:pectinesterase
MGRIAAHYPREIFFRLRQTLFDTTMNKLITLLTLALATALPTTTPAAPGALSVKAVNPLAIARPGQTIELSAKDIAPLEAKALNLIHVKDASGKEVLCQAVDTDFDALRKPDVLIFQADFAPNEAKTFTVSVGAKQVFAKEQFRAHGRFVRERFDDFAWENDRIAHRTYGQGLETWAGEPLTSSTIDIWSKRVPQMVINDWYLTDNYHADTGTGADFYAAGLSRGCGGNGLWADGKLWVSRNFVNSRVLANGPIRVCFELVYDAFDVNGAKVSEVKRITLDAGSNLDHFQSFYQPPAGAGPLISAVGLKKVAGEERTFNAELGWMGVWEKVEKNQGMQGLAIVVPPASLAGGAQDKLNNLLLVKATPGNTVSYWAGFTWEKAGQFADFAAWRKYLDEFAQGLASPIQVSVAAQ